MLLNFIKGDYYLEMKLKLLEIHTKTYLTLNKN